MAKNLTDREKIIIEDLIEESDWYSSFRGFLVIGDICVLLLVTLLFGVIGFIIALIIIVFGWVNGPRRRKREREKLKRKYSRALLAGASVKEIKKAKSFFKFKTESNLDDLINKYEK